MKYIFGPVPSRRLGSSLGIDVIPHKTCNLDCIYCEVGKTNKMTITKKSFMKIDDVIAELNEIYPMLKEKIDVVTVTGSGEPTLNKDLYDIITEIKKIVIHPTVLLTNGTLVTDDEVKKSMHEFDIVVPSIDAVSQDIFHKINKPHKKLNLGDILKHLKIFSDNYNGKLYIEVLLVKGINDNYTELKKIADYIKGLKYEKVQLNTVFRPPAYQEAKGLTDKELLEAAILLKKEGIKVEPVQNFIKDLKIWNGKPEELIISTLKMRPCTVKDLESIFDLGEDYIKSLIASSKEIKSYLHNGEIFYKSER